MYKNTKENGITLVALVITIIVLLILAGVTISYISGGIIDKTKVAIKDYENADNRQQGAIDDIGEYNKEGIDLEKVYDEEGVEDNIAPTDLFEYEIINDGSIASSYMQNLPTKTARIIGIKPEYIDIQSRGSLNWYYAIKYNGISDVLVIPYQAELDENGNVTENGEMYKITEVNLSIEGKNHNGTSFPSIRKVIYPNTVEKIEQNQIIGVKGSDYVPQPSEIILSDNLKVIGYGAFQNTMIKSIKIPDTVTSIGNYAFYNCDLLTNIEIPDGVTSIGESAFYSCNSLTNIEIPDGVTSIENYAFYNCNSLTNIEIPNSVTSIGEQAFQYCIGLKKIVIPKNIENIGRIAFNDWNSDQTIYFECSEEDSKSWDPDWKKYCDAKIVWNYNPNEATE